MQRSIGKRVGDAATAPQLTAMLTVPFSPFSSQTPFEWHAIGEGDASEDTEGTEGVVGQVADELHVEVVNGDLIDRKVEVAETVAGELTEDTHKDDHEQPPAGAVYLAEFGLGGY